MLIHETANTARDFFVFIITFDVIHDSLITTEESPL
jgi:hypothetical protein